MQKLCSYNVVSVIHIMTKIAMIITFCKCFKFKKKIDVLDTTVQ